METHQIQEKLFASFKTGTIDNYGEEISEASWKEIMEDNNFSSNTSQLVNAYVPP